MSERRALLKDKESLGNIDKFRHIFSSLQSLSDFADDSEREMLINADEA